MITFRVQIQPIMENDSKNVLMQYLYRLAERAGIEGADQVNFRKREGLLLQLKSRDHEAWYVISRLFDAFMREDRLNNDREKKEKAFPLWSSEHAAAEREKVQAEHELVTFCKTNGIPVGVAVSGD